MSEPTPSPTPDPPALSAQQADTLLRADLRNIAAKLKSGKTLSAAERNLLQSVRAGGAPSAANFVSNQVELASILGVHRKTIQRARQTDGNPGVRPDGRWDVNAWREFLGQRGIADEDVPSERAERARYLLLKSDKLEFQLAAMRGEYMPRAEARRVFTQFVTAAKLRSIAGVERLVALIRLAPDNVSAHEVARSEILELWRDMERGEWYTPPTS